MPSHVYFLIVAFLSTRSYLRYPWPHVPNFQQRQYLNIAISHAFRTSVIMVIYLLYSMISYWVLWHIYLGAVILPQFFYNSTKSRIGQDTGHFRRAATSTGAGFLPYPENISLYFLCPSMLFARANIFYGYKIIIRSGCLPS